MALNIETFDDEAFYNSVRNQLFSDTTPVEVPDSLIQDQSVLGSASDYVMDACVDLIATSVDGSSVVGLASPLTRNILRSLTAEEFLYTDVGQTAIDARISASEEGFTADTKTAISTLLTAIQKRQFRRAVIYRSAGLIVPILRQRLSENTGGFSERMNAVSWETKQLSLFVRAEEEVERFGDVKRGTGTGGDAFQNNADRTNRAIYENLEIIVTTESAI